MTGGAGGARPGSSGWEAAAALAGGRAVASAQAAQGRAQGGRRRACHAGRRPAPAPPAELALARWALGGASIPSLAMLRRAVAARYTRDAAGSFAALLLSQFAAELLRSGAGRVACNTGESATLGYSKEGEPTLVKRRHDVDAMTHSMSISENIRLYISILIGRNMKMR